MDPKAFDTQLEKALKKAPEIDVLREANKNIALEKSPNSIVVSYESRNARIHEELKKLYDFIAQWWGYKTMDHMIAIAHGELLARAIHDPLKFGPGAIKAIAQIQEKIHPQETISAKRKIPGESKHSIAARMVDHFKKAPPPPPPSSESEES